MSAMLTTGVAHLPCTNVLILNPKVGLTLVMSSPLRFFIMVVLPALSSPLDRASDLVVTKTS